jgi:hypothetical protein
LNRIRRRDRMQLVPERPARSFEPNNPPPIKQGRAIELILSF